MVEYKLTYTPDGRIKKELTYKDTIFSYTMIPDQYGKTGDKLAFMYQVAVKFPDEKEDVLDALNDLPFAEDSGIEDILLLLSEHE